MAPAWPCTGYLPSPKLSSVLLVPRQPNLWFRPASATSLRTPVSCPSVSTSFLGTMNSDRPLVPASRWLAGRDPHLVALDAIARAQRVAGKVRAIGHGPGRHIAERGACLRLGQAHG